MTVPAFVSVVEAARLLSLCREEVRQEILRGHLDACMPRRKWLITRESLERWIELRTDEARQATARRNGLDYLRHWEPPMSGGGGRGTRAAEGALAVLRGGAR